jgi:hypothetical protein
MLEVEPSPHSVRKKMGPEHPSGHEERAFRQPFGNEKESLLRYRIVSSHSIEDVEKEVNACLEQLSYELYGSPFSSAIATCRHS